MMRIPGIASEIAVVLIGVCIGTVRLAIKDFRTYKEKRRQRFESKLKP